MVAFCIRNTYGGKSVCKEGTAKVTTRLCNEEIRCLRRNLHLILQAPILILFGRHCQVRVPHSYFSNSRLWWASWSRHNKVKPGEWNGRTLRKLCAETCLARCVPAWQSNWIYSWSIGYFGWLLQLQIGFRKGMLQLTFNIQYFICKKGRLLRWHGNPWYEKILSLHINFQSHLQSQTK